MGTSIMWNLTLTLGEATMGKGQGHYAFFILKYVTVFSFFLSFIKLNQTSPETMSKFGFVR